MQDARAAEYFQSRFTFEAGRAAVWKVISGYLQRWIPPDGRVLDLGAGYCSLINQVQAREKYAVDIFPEFVRFAQPEVQTHVGSCENLGHLATGYLDAVFASNLLEHLSRAALTQTLAEVRRVVKPGGRLIVIQPNFRYCYREYFDDYTHVQVFTHVGLADLLSVSGFAIERVEPRFLPASFKSRLPKWPWLTRLYLRLPWRPFAGQMLVVGRRLA